MYTTVTRRLSTQNTQQLAGRGSAAPPKVAYLSGGVLPRPSDFEHGSSRFSSTGTVEQRHTLVTHTHTHTGRARTDGVRVQAGRLVTVLKQSLPDEVSGERGVGGG